MSTFSSLKTVAERAPGWCNASAAGAAIAVSTRVRLARNLLGQAFRSQLSTAEQTNLTGMLLDSIGRCLSWPDGLRLDLADCDEAARTLLIERHLASRDLAAGARPGGLVARADERAAVMVNEEDHLRIQAIQPGFDLNDTLSRAIALDQSLESEHAWAIDPRLGYLTACPTNVGTGLRIGVMLHLPALAESREIPRLLRGLGRLHLVARGLDGEGSEPTGHFYQISNQRTLGMSEQGLADRVNEAVSTVIRHEELAREALLERQPELLADRIHRAFAILSNARILEGSEALSQLSWLRLGRCVAVGPEVPWEILDRLWTQVRPGHIQVLHPGQAGSNSQRDRLRADFVRAALAPYH